MKTIAFLVVDDRKLTPEELAAWAFLSGLKKFRSQRIGFADLLRPRRAPGKFDVIWWHFDESTSLPADALDPKIIASLRDHVLSGRGLLLSLLAAPYVVDLGFESKGPNVCDSGTWSESSPITGCRDIRGFAGFGQHPIFDGFPGGLYTWTPETGDRYTGAFYKDETPASGRVVAVERSYIKLDETKRIIIEYDDANGRALSIGSHLFFADQDERFRVHLKKFTANCLSYLSTPRVRHHQQHSRKNEAGRSYWKFDPPTVGEFAHMSRPMRKPNLRLPGQSNDLVIYRDLSAADKEEEMFALSGRSILVTGKERTGIAEVWSHPIRTLKDVKIGFRLGEFPYRSASELNPIVAIRPESVTRRFVLDEGTIVETVFADLRHAAGAIHYQVKSAKPVQIILIARVDLRHMWPLSERATGSLRYAWDETLRAAMVTDLEGKATSILGCSALPAEHLVGQFSDISCEDDHLTSSRTSATEVTIGLRIILPPGKSRCVFVFAGSAENVRGAAQTYRAVMQNPVSSLIKQRKHFVSLEKNCTRVVTPDEQFNKAYRWSLVGLDKFFVETQGLGSSLMAGYGLSSSGWDGGHAVSGRPGYAWYFGRDSAWASLALLDCGDHDKVRNVLEFLGRYQDENGKILHELTTSGYVHYDAADSTPLYLYLMGRYIRTTGDRSFARLEFQKVRKAVQYCFSTDTDADHLIENTNSGHGWVEGGQLFPAHAEHYLVSCWAAALTESSFVADLAGERSFSARWRKEARIVREKLEVEFWNPRTQFYNFAKLPDATFNEEKTILPAVGMYLGCADRQKAQASLREYASDGFSADWGVRIISRASPLFNPAGYHYGSIWPLFTGWTALAEFALGRPIQGYMHLLSNLLLHDQFSAGCFQEVLHGERFKAEGVCAHQAWSDSMAIQPVLEGMLGLKVNAVDRMIELSPYLPPHWRDLRVRGIRIGNQRVGMTIQRGKSETVYSFFPESGFKRSQRLRAVTLKFTPLFPLGTRIHEIRIGPRKQKVNVLAEDYPSLPPIHIPLNKKIDVRILHSGGVSAIPPIPHLHRGQESTGMRIIDERWKDNSYFLIVEGQSGREYLLDVMDHSSTIKAIEGAPVLSQNDDHLILVVDFKGNIGERKYERREIRFAT